MDYQDDDDGEQPTWRDDLRTEQVHEFIRAAVGAAAAAETELPHIVACSDSVTGTVSFSGPFPNGLAALVFAERESAVDRQLNQGPPLVFRVAALFAPDQPVEY